MSSAFITVLSLSEIANHILSDKLRPIEIESLGCVHIKTLELENVGLKFDPLSALVVMKVTRWTQLHVHTIEVLRAKGYEGSIIAMSPELSERQQSLLPPHERGKITFIEPGDDRELLGLVRRILAMPDSGLRGCPRFEVQQSAEMFFAENTRYRACMISNISKTGACLKFESVPHLKKGDLVNLTIRFGEGEDAQRLAATVAWSHPTKGTIGVEFLRMPVSQTQNRTKPSTHLRDKKESGDYETSHSSEFIDVLSEITSRLAV